VTGRGRVAIAGAAAITVAIAGLQGLQGLMGSFNPRWEVQVLITVGVLCFTLFAQRHAARRSAAAEREERATLLRRSLRAWPIPRVAQTRAEALGVFPQRRDESERGYARRAADEPLRDALRSSPLVLVLGPRLAGKSRTTAEAAREVLGDALAIVPCDGRALRQLLRLDDVLAFRDGERVLWLDGLKRFVRAVDGDLLDRLARAGVRVVATEREGTWRRMLASDGAPGESAKAVAARAQVVVVPLRPDPGELAEAQGLYPRRHLSAGIGPGLASAGEEPDPPPAPGQAPEEPPDRAQPALRDPLVLAPLAISLACLCLVGYFAVSGNFEKPTPPTIAQQVDDARSKGARGGRVLVDEKRVEFHGPGESSYFFAFSDRAGTPPERARSHELQVWDVRGDDLVQAFSFRPEKLGDERALYQYRDTGDVDGDGAQELIGGWGTDAIPGELIFPFALDWDAGERTYRMISLTPDRTALTTRGRGEDVAGLRASYRNRLSLTDPDPVHQKGPLTIAGYRAQDFAVTPSHQVLIGSYVTDIRADVSHRLVELQSHLFHRAGGEPSLTRCTPEGSDLLTARLPLDDIRLLEGAIKDHWLDVTGDRSCVTIE
jgi:hypothetical protein